MKTLKILLFSCCIAIILTALAQAEQPKIDLNRMNWGQSLPSGANITFNNGYIHNLKNGTAPQDAVTLSQLTARSGANYYVSVGPYSWCDYVTDGVDDAVQIQAAIDAVYAKGGGTVKLAIGNYNIGDYTITVKNSTTLEGSNMPFQNIHTTWVGGKAQVSRLNITSTTKNAIKMCSSTAIRCIQFNYPNQVDSSSPIAYPATIKLDAMAYMPVIEYIQTGNCYIFLDATAVHHGMIVSNIVGFPIYIGIYEDQNLDETYVTNIHFNPNFRTNSVMTTSLGSWMLDNSKAYYINGTDGGIYTNCFAWGYRYGFYIRYVNHLNIIKPQMDCVIQAVYATDSNRLCIDGLWAYDLNWVTSSYSSSSSCVRLITVNNALITNSVFNVGLTAIQVDGNQATINQNKIIFGDSGTTSYGILFCGTSCCVNSNNILGGVGSVKTGILAYHCNTVTIVGNAIDSCNYAILLDTCSYTNVGFNVKRSSGAFPESGGTNVVDHNIGN